MTNLERDLYKRIDDLRHKVAELEELVSFEKEKAAKLREAVINAAKGPSETLKGSKV